MARRCGCEQAPENTVWMELDFESGTYSRCDPKGCDIYTVTYSSGGVFTTVRLSQVGTLLKVVNDGSEFIDVATVGVAVITSFGTCQPND